MWHFGFPRSLLLVQNFEKTPHLSHWSSYMIMTINYEKALIWRSRQFHAYHLKGKVWHFPSSLCIFISSETIIETPISPKFFKTSQTLFCYCFLSLQNSLLHPFPEISCLCSSTPMSFRVFLGFSAAVQRTFSSPSTNFKFFTYFSTEGRFFGPFSEFEIFLSLSFWSIFVSTCLYFFVCLRLPFMRYIIAIKIVVVGCRT